MKKHIKILQELKKISQQYLTLVQTESWEVIEEIATYIKTFGEQIDSAGISTKDDLVTINSLKSSDPILFANTVFDYLKLLIDEYTLLISNQEKIKIIKSYKFVNTNLTFIKDEEGNHQFIYETEQSLDEVTKKISKDTQAIILVGFGSGHLVSQLTNKYQVSVIEPYKVLDTLMVDNIISYENEIDIESKIKIELQRFIGLKTEILMHPLYKQTKHTLGVIKLIRDLFQQIRIDLNTRVLYTEKWYKQYLLNVNILKNEKKRIINIDNLEKFHLGERGLMIAGGPSLEEAIPYLKDAQYAYYIVAIGQVVKVLLENDITPDYIVSTDSEIANAHFFKDIHIDMPLVYPLQTNSYIPSVVKGGLIPYADNKITQELLAYSKNAFGVAPTVAISAVMFMDYAGFSTIGLIGQDLALRKGEYYSKSVKQVSSNNGQLSTTLYDVKLNSGEVGKTTPVLKSFLSSYNRLVFHNPDLKIKLINYAENGAEINHINYKPLLDLEQGTINKIKVVQGIDSLHPSEDSLMLIFNNILVKLESIEKKIRRNTNQHAISKKDFEKCLIEWDAMIELQSFKSHVMPLQVVNLLVIQNKIKFYNKFDQSSDTRIQILKMMANILENMIKQLRSLKKIENYKILVDDLNSELL